MELTTTPITHDHTERSQSPQTNYHTYLHSLACPQVYGAWVGSSVVCYNHIDVGRLLLPLLPVPSIPLVSANWPYSTLLLIIGKWLIKVWVLIKVVLVVPSSTQTFKHILRWLLAVLS